MSQPFHFAFFVTNLESTRHFYGDLLGCREGRSAETWIDFDFFGNQISAHVGTPSVDNSKHGDVDGVAVPMPHFGAILDWRDFEELAARLKARKVTFIIEPHIRYAGEPGEQYTMFFRDPSGNPLEFKAFRNPSEVFSI
jgi:extradiol dioxygenase family protein